MSSTEKVINFIDGALKFATLGRATASGEVGFFAKELFFETAKDFMNPEHLSEILGVSDNVSADIVTEFTKLAYESATNQIKTLADEIEATAGAYLTGAKAIENISRLAGIELDKPKDAKVAAIKTAIEFVKEFFKNQNIQNVEKISENQ